MQTKMYALLVALLASVAFVGCTSDDEATESGALKQLSFSAVADAGSRPSYASERMKTRLLANDGNKVEFCKDDAISVFDGTTHQNKRFATNEEGASVTFSGAAPESETYTALYPYQKDATISGSTITAVLPTTQYAQAGTTFDPAAVLSVATTTKTDMNFAFQNVCGLVKFTTTEALAKVVFKGNNGEKVAGNVSITVNDAPTYTCEDATDITLKPAADADAISAGTYYISVLPRAFANGFTLEAYKTSSSTKADYALKIGTNVEVERSQILNVGKLEYDPFNGHDYVDLGIEVDGKKVLWATMNVGASAPEKYGDYFAWGETTPYYEAGWTTDGKTGTVKFADTGGTWKTTPKDYSTKGYNWVNYAWCAGTNKTLTKYCNDSSKGNNGYTDTLTQLELADDAAHVNWGGDWVMPTTAEWQALYNNTTFTWTANYNNTGVAGYEVKGKDAYASKSIFLPAAGYFYGTSVRLVGSNGDYWSSSLSTGNPAYAYGLYFNSDDVSPAGSNGRYYGQSVRPVLRMASGE